MFLCLTSLSFMSKAGLCETLTLNIVSRYGVHCFGGGASATSPWDLGRPSLLLAGKQITSLHLLIKAEAAAVTRIHVQRSLFAHDSAKVTSLNVHWCRITGTYWRALECRDCRSTVECGVCGVPRVTAPVCGGVRVFGRSRGAWVLAVEGIAGVNTPP